MLGLDPRGNVDETGGRCPTCDVVLVPVLYGYPGPEAVEAAERGEVVLGGCCVEEPRWACPVCGDREPF